jgi:hypothetical protein
VYLWTARELDDTCHALTTEERKSLNLQIEVMLKDLKLTAAEMNHRMKDSGSVADMKCDGKVAQLLFSMARSKQSDAAPEKQKSEEEEDSSEWAFVQESWKKNFKELPGGRLAAFEDCWKGTLSSLEVECAWLRRAMWCGSVWVKPQLRTAHLRMAAQGGKTIM